MAAQGRCFAAGFQWLALTCWLTALDTRDRARVAISAVSFFAIDGCAVFRTIFYFRILQEYLRKTSRPGHLRLYLTDQ
jgi:hypothetical protein